MTQLEALRANGFRRIGAPGRGFRWVAPNGRPAPRADAERLDALRLPPAWTEVHASPSSRAKLQAVGRDKAGRWQYRYHAGFRAAQEHAKHRRLLRFAGALPRIRAAIDRDLARPGLPREKVLAGAVRILMTCFMRAGSEVYMKANGSYGVATLRAKHVQVQGETVRFDFPGKSGRRHVRELRDARIARLVRRLLKVPGRDLLKFEADDGIVDVRRRHINAYIREIAGGTWTAKDFRTWAGTLICACELARREPELVPGRTSRRKTAVAAIKATAHVLGNTPAVCRASYINPGVLSAHERGQVVEAFFATVHDLVAHRHGLHRAERALLALLAAADAAPARPAARSDGASRAAARAIRPPREVALPASWAR